MLAASLLALIALGQTLHVQARTPAPCPILLADFEAAIPTAAMSGCPEMLSGKSRICRFRAAGGAVHVYAFAEEDPQCLLATRAYPPPLFELLVQ